MRIRYTPRARSDLQSILQYIDERSPLGARSVKAGHPEDDRAHRPVSRGRPTRRGQATRVLPAGRYPYLIYWSIEDGEAWIVHIRHARRRPWTGQE
jgi:toxin ParE1/3/4